MDKYKLGDYFYSVEKTWHVPPKLYLYRIKFMKAGIDYDYNCVDLYTFEETSGMTFIEGSATYTESTVIEFKDIPTLRLLYA